MRNVLVPGWIISSTDGDKHWIGYGKLIQLYGLNPRECERWNPFRPYPEGTKFYRARYGGNYEQD